nr:hypothetical protein GCM10020092_083680 [Actinoplanes digitatis]
MLAIPMKVHECSSTNWVTTKATPSGSSRACGVSSWLTSRARLSTRSSGRSSAGGPASRLRGVPAGRAGGTPGEREQPLAQRRRLPDGQVGERRLGLAAADHLEPELGEAGELGEQRLAQLDGL